MSLALAAAAAFFLSASLTRWFRSVALRRGLLDVPNERSSHATPTPRGGGLAIVLVVSAGWLAVAAGFAGWRLAAIATAVSGLAVAIVGYIDDRQGVPQMQRFLVHIAAVALVLYASRHLGQLVMPGLPDVPLLQGVIALVALVWLLNLFNFMDGIDGLAGMEAAFVALGLATCMWIGPGASPALLVLCVVTAAASLGFLVLNWPPARIFMGDVGSGFLGLMLGALAVVTNREAGLSAWVPAILLAAFVTDATLTLVRRMARGERWYAAHRSHGYQWLSRRFGRHLPVTLAALAVNVLWLLPLAVAAVCWPHVAWVFAAAAYASLVPMLLWAGAGRAETARTPG